MKAILILCTILSLVIIIEFGYCLKRDCMGTKKEAATITETPTGMDYQIVLVPANNYGVSPDSIQIWDGKRLVGTVAIIENTPIGNLIYDDNQ